VPEIEPPPDTSDQEPPAGAAINGFVAPSQISAVLVVLLAVPRSSFTVKLALLEVPGQPPFAGTVY